MKILAAAVLMITLCVGATFATSLFDYRGIFPADRESGAKITNYILLKKDVRIRFELDEQGQGTTDRVRIEKIQLTSQNSVLFSDPDGITSLSVPETGIYEITLVPSAAHRGEIRFVLKVIDISDEAQPDQPASASVSLPASVDLSQVTIIDSTKPEPSEQPEKQLTSSTTSLNTVADSTASATAILSTGTSVVANDYPVLEAPAPDFFINPFNGFKFVGEGINLLSDADRQKQIQIFNRLADGASAAVEGSFFSPEPDVLIFIPAKIMPGAMYHLEIFDAAGSRRAEHHIAALPELKIEFVKMASELHASIIWQPQTSLMSNPAGQMLALSGCDISVNSGEDSLLVLTGEQVSQPFGSQAGINWRARPYAVDVEIPLSLIAEECRVDVMASIDGTAKRGVAYRSTWKKTDEDLDFSDVEASDDLIYDSAKQNFSVASFSVREQMPDTASFTLAKSFLLVEDDADSLVSWPQDVVWDENGSLWVLDSQLRRIANYNTAGIQRTSFGARGDTPGSLGLPVALAQKNANLYVSDTSRHAVHKFTTEGLFVVSIVSEPLSGITIDLPGGICFRKDEMWVADRGSARILCFNQQGGFLGSFGSTSVAPILAPVSVRADEDSLFILEKSGLVKKFSPMGQFDATFQSGSSEGSGLDVDRWGGIWICDAGKFRVVRFSKQGSALTELAAPPAAKPWLPTAVAVRSDGKVAVTDATNKMLHIFVPAE